MVSIVGQTAPELLDNASDFFPKGNHLDVGTMIFVDLDCKSCSVLLANYFEEMNSDAHNRNHRN